MPARPDAVRRHAPVMLPARRIGPVAAITRRVLVALGLVCLVALIVYIDRDGYADNADGEVTLLDAFYYSTVSITTTGYGDVAPVSDSARLITTLVVTPVRILFLVLLVGTTIEVLTERWRESIRRDRWRRRLDHHTIICGYGVKGRSAIDALCGDGADPKGIVVIERDRETAQRAQLSGLAVVIGDASSTDVLREAEVGKATSVIVAPNRDDTAVLITLTARELNPTARIVVSCRESENVHLLEQSGADGVVVSSESAGRLLGIGARNARVATVLEDLLTTGQGIEIQERVVAADEAGQPPRLAPGEIAVAVVRGDERLAFGDPRATPLQLGDHLIVLANALA